MTSAEANVFANGVHAMARQAPEWGYGEVRRMKSVTMAVLVWPLKDSLFDLGPLRHHADNCHACHTNPDAPAPPPNRRDRHSSKWDFR